MINFNPVILKYYDKGNSLESQSQQAAMLITSMLFIATCI